MRKLFVAAVAGAFLLTGAPVLAQDDKVTEDVTEYFMDGDNVQGSTIFPDDGIVTVRHRGKSKSLIKVRRHFVAEMIKAVEDI